MALTTAHLVWWLLVIGIELWRDDPLVWVGHENRDHSGARPLFGGSNIPGRALVLVAAPSRSREGCGLTRKCSRQKEA